MTALDDLNRWADILKRNQQTVFCRPEQEDNVREALALSGVSAFYDVQVSDTVPPGALFIAKGWFS